MTATLAPPPEANVARISTVVRTETVGKPLLPVALARAVAFTALAAWGALHWMSMLEPAEPGRGWLTVLVGLIAVGTMLAAGRLEGRRRTVVAVASIVPLAALMLLAGRVADELLLPTRWEVLAEGIGRGLYDLPGVRVPYRGLDEWVRTVLPLGASALVLLAALLAFWPRSRGRLGFPALALLVLTALFVVPIVALDFTAEFLRGAVFTVLMVAFLRLEKLRRPDGLAAGVLAIAITLVALVAAPLLNKDTPWFDYETWALQTSSSKSTTFTWDHSYDGLNWPRDGRELLRVRAQRPAYWKADNLDTFDGEKWLRSTVDYSVPEYPTDPERLEDWTQTIRVSIRNLRSDMFITAGYASDVDIPRHFDIPTADGLYRSPRTLRRGDTYTAEVYTPRPPQNQRERVGSDFDPSLSAYTTIYTTQLGIPGAQHIRMTFPFFGVQVGGIEVGPPDDTTPEQMLAGTGSPAPTRCPSNCSRTPRRRRITSRPSSTTWATSRSRTRNRRRRRRARSRGSCSTPRPATASSTRARWHCCCGWAASRRGSSPGSPRARRTPRPTSTWSATSTPTRGSRSTTPTGAGSRSTPRPRPRRRAASPPTRRARAAGPPARSRGSATSRPSAARASPPRVRPKPWWYWPIRGLVVLAVVGLVLLAVRRWRRGAPPALTELERALRRTRRAPTPGTTLHALEQRFSATPAAAGYVRALRESRYGDAPIHPTRAQRRGLRSELGRGTGLLGHLRAWWALPPR